MNWHTANLRKQRAPRRSRRKKPPISAGWREWLDMILPDLMRQNLLHEDSIFARLMKPREESFRGRRFQFPQLSRSPAAEPGLAAATRYAAVSSSRLPGIVRAAKSIWLSQDGKCAECGEPLPFAEATKRAMSFTLICNACYEKRPPVFIVIDDLESE